MSNYKEPTNTVAMLRAVLAPFADECIFAGPQHEFVTVARSACDAARAALDAPAPPDAVTVKPLEWVDFKGWGAKAAGFYQANYMIQYWDSQQQWEVSLSYPGYGTGYAGARWHKTMDDAKAAAQADYDAIIMAALDVHPITAHDAAKVPEVKALMEVAHRAKVVLAEREPYPLPVLHDLLSALRAIAGGEA